MSNKIDEIELRSDEVQDILSKIPNWMIRYGSTLFFALLLLVLSLSWIIKYPDIYQVQFLSLIKAKKIITLKFRCVFLHSISAC